MQSDSPSSQRSSEEEVSCNSQSNHQTLFPDFLGEPRFLSQFPAEWLDVSQQGSGEPPVKEAEQVPAACWL